MVRIKRIKERLMERIRTLIYITKNWREVAGEMDIQRRLIEKGWDIHTARLATAYLGKALEELNKDWDKYYYDNQKDEWVKMGEEDEDEGTE